MKVIDSKATLQNELERIRPARKSIGLVPTMGNLHEGHLTLVAAARKQCDFVLATIFVNPLQFGPSEDLENYPRTLGEDLEKLAAGGCNGVFVPTEAEMYPNGLDDQTLVTVPGLSERHCGASRPGHFAGVCTVVSKLFNLTHPDVAFFGEKDFQQLLIIRKMSTDLCIPVRIEGVPTVRNDQGLALSSRNNYLNDRELAIAPALYRQLQDTARKIQQGKINFDQLQRDAIAGLEAAGLKTDYYNICNASTLAPARNHDTELVILAAAWLGGTRLIDNIQLKAASRGQ